MSDEPERSCDRLFKDAERWQKSREAQWKKNTEKECTRREPFTGGKKSFQEDKKAKEGKNQKSIQENERSIPKERIMPWNTHGPLSSQVNAYLTPLEPKSAERAGQKTPREVMEEARVALKRAPQHSKERSFMHRSELDGGLPRHETKPKDLYMSFPAQVAPDESLMYKPGQRDLTTAESQTIQRLYSSEFSAQRNKAQKQQEAQKRLDESIKKREGRDICAPGKESLSHRAQSARVTKEKQPMHRSSSPRFSYYPKAEVNPHSPRVRR